MLWDLEEMQRRLVSARICLRACDESYLPLPIDSDRFKETNIPGVLSIREIWDSETDTYARVFITDSAIYIAVKGTQELRDWLTNKKIGKRWHYGLKMHRGYAIAAQSIQSEINKIVLECGLPVWVCGHSLGGGVAVGLVAGLLDLEVAYDRSLNITLITFGQPKVSTKREIDKRITCTYVRVQNGSDAVPRQPAIPFYYSHGGELWYIDNDGVLEINSSWKERFFDRFLTFSDRYTDHSTADYIENF